MTTAQTEITVEITVNATVENVWSFFNLPQHIINWNFADPSWQCPKAENDLRVGGKFLSRMEAKDGSFGFEFWGVYNQVKLNELIAYTLGDGRNVKISFTSDGVTTKVVETFEAESENPIELQQGGWQAILNNFKNYTETNL